jgi:hypothetical protein
MDERRKGFLGGVAFYPWLVAAIAVLVAGVHIVVTNRVRADLGRTRAQVAALTSELESERRWALALASPGVRTASFTLTPSGDLSLRARATVDPESRKALLVFEGFNPPGGHAYELWALHGNTPFTLGRIKTDATGRAVLRVEDLGDVGSVTAFVISLETEGSAPSATGAAPREPMGPIVMIGSLGS